MCTFILSNEFVCNVFSLKKTYLLEKLKYTLLEKMKVDLFEWFTKIYYYFSVGFVHVEVASS